MLLFCTIKIFLQSEMGVQKSIVKAQILLEKPSSLGFIFKVT